MLLPLSENGRQVVEALIKAPVAWQTPAELALTIKRELEETTDLLSDLDCGGWLSAWERDREIVVTLSINAASRLGVRLVEIGQDEVPRWARVGEPEPPCPKASRVFASERAATLDLVVDPSGTPEEMAEQAEEALIRSMIPSDPRHRAFIAGLPGPTLLLGIGLSPWPGPGSSTTTGYAIGRPTSCPSCGSKRLRPSMYCLYCDRWGLDHLLKNEPPPRVQVFRDPRDDARRRDLDRESRKAKRKTRRTAQIEAERRPARRPSQLRQPQA